MAVGKITAYVLANTSNFTAGMKTSKRQLGELDKKVSVSAAGLVKWGAAAAAAGAAAVGAMVKAGLEMVDSQAKLARSMDGTIGGLEGLQRAAKDSGVDVSALNSSVQRMQVSLGEARLGTGRAADALKNLGLTAGELAKVDVDERMAMLSDAMHEGRMTADQMAETLGSLGIRNREMILLMQGGGDAIRDATKEMEGYGLAVSSVDAAMVEHLNDQLNRARDVIRGIVTQMAVHAAPALQAVVDIFSEMTGETGGFTNFFQRAVEAILKGAGHVANAFRGWQLIWKSLQIAFQTVTTFILRIMASISKAVEGVVESSLKQINWLINQANRVLPKRLQYVNIMEGTAKDVTGLLEAMAEDSKKALTKMQKDLADIASDERPGDKLWQAYQDALSKKEVIAAAHEAREKDRLARLSEAEANAASKAAKAAEDRADIDAQKEQERLTAQLERLEYHLFEEEQKLEDAHLRRLLQLEELAEAEMFSAERLVQLKEGLEADHLEKLRELRQQSADDSEELTKVSMESMVSIMTSGMRSISQIIGRETRIAFEINKAAAIVEATIATLLQVTKNLENPWLAAAIGAAGALNIAAIASQQFGSRGTARPHEVSQSAGASGAGASGGSSSPSSGTLTVSGLDPSSLFTGAAVSQLAEELLEYQRQGGRVLVQ